MTSCVLYRGDCLEVMLRLEAGSVDMCFADLPYATEGQQVTANTWDMPFDLKALWPAIMHASRKHGVTAFTAKQVFACSLVLSNKKMFRYDLIWDKVRPSRHLHAKRMPLLRHESVLIFYQPPCIYNPIMEHRMQPKRRGSTRVHSSNAKTPNFAALDSAHIYTEKFPTTLVALPRENYTVHPTQKPVALLEWLIKTYTNEGDTVLDPVFGSNTTGVACARLGRNYIGIEKDAEYFRIGTERINKERLALGLSGAVVHE